MQRTKESNYADNQMFPEVHIDFRVNRPSLGLHVTSQPPFFLKFI